MSRIRIIAILLVLLVFLYSWKKLIYGIYFLIFSLPFAFLPWILGSNLAISEALIFVVLSVFCIKNFNKREIKIKRTKFDLPILAFLGITILSAIVTLNSASYVFTLRILLATFEFVLIYFLAVNIVRKENVKGAVALLLFASFIAALYGVFQFIFLNVERANSFFDHPNFFGMFLIMVLPLSIYYFLKSKHKKIIWMLPVLLFFTLLLTFSRGAWIGFFSSLIFCVAIVKIKRDRKISLLVVLSILFLFLLLFFIYIEISYKEVEIQVNSSEWQTYNFSVNGEGALRIKFINDYYNPSLKEDRNLYVANITKTIVTPRVVRKDKVTDCGDYCPLPSADFIQTRVNGSFSFLMKADYGRGWPIALVSWQEDSYKKKIRESFLMERFKTGDEGLGNRGMVWKQALGKVKENPFFGSGFISLEVNNKKVEHTHNLYLQLWLERGIFCLLIFIWILFLFFKDTQKYSKYSLAIFVGIFAFLVHGLFDYSLKIGFLFFVYLALLEVFQE